jgi:hypothetical protein
MFQSPIQVSRIARIFSIIEDKIEGPGQTGPTIGASPRRKSIVSHSRLQLRRAPRVGWVDSSVISFPHVTAARDPDTAVATQIAELSA